MEKVSDALAQQEVVVPMGTTTTQQEQAGAVSGGHALANHTREESKHGTRHTDEGVDSPRYVQLANADASGRVLPWETGDGGAPLALSGSESDSPQHSPTAQHTHQHNTHTLARRRAHSGGDDDDAASDLQTDRTRYSSEVDLTQVALKEVDEGEHSRRRGEQADWPGDEQGTGEEEEEDDDCSINLSDESSELSESWSSTEENSFRDHATFDPYALSRCRVSRTLSMTFLALCSPFSFSLSVVLFTHSLTHTHTHSLSLSLIIFSFQPTFSLSLSSNHSIQLSIV
jgi:hypothetical protein